LLCSAGFTLNQQTTSQPASNIFSLQQISTTSYQPQPAEKSELIATLAKVAS